jgi:hypothetical protein
MIFVGVCALGSFALVSGWLGPCLLLLGPWPGVFADRRKGGTGFWGAIVSGVSTSCAAVVLDYFVARFLFHDTTDIDWAGGLCFLLPLFTGVGVILGTLWGLLSTFEFNARFDRGIKFLADPLAERPESQ